MESVPNSKKTFGNCFLAKFCDLKFLNFTMQRICFYGKKDKFCQILGEKKMSPNFYSRLQAPVCFFFFAFQFCDIAKVAIMDEMN